MAGPMGSCTFLVFNQPVYYQEGHGSPYPSFDGAERKLPNGMTVTITHPIDGLRFRSANPGQPAKVTAIPTFRR